MRIIKTIENQNNTSYNHYIAYDVNNQIIKHDDREIHHVEISKYCRKIHDELLKRYYNAGKTSFVIHMKNSGDDLTITELNDEFTITGGFYRTPITLSNLYAVANVIINYDDDKMIDMLQKQNAIENSYDDGIYDEYLITLKG